MEHAQINQAILALARRIAVRLRELPELFEVARGNLVRWSRIALLRKNGTASCWQIRRVYRKIESMKLDLLLEYRGGLVLIAWARETSLGLYMGVRFFPGVEDLSYFKDGHRQLLRFPSMPDGERKREEVPLDDRPPIPLDDCCTGWMALRAAKLVWRAWAGWYQ